MQADHMNPNQMKAWLQFKKGFLDCKPNPSIIKRLSGKQTKSKEYVPIEYILGYMEELFPFNDQRITQVLQVNEVREVWDKRSNKNVVKYIDLITVSIEIHLHVYVSGEYVTTRVVSGVGEAIRRAGGHASVQIAKSYAIKNAMKVFTAFGKGMHEQEGQRFEPDTFNAQAAIAKSVDKPSEVKKLTENL